MGYNSRGATDRTRIVMTIMRCVPCVRQAFQNVARFRRDTIQPRTNARRYVARVVESVGGNKSAAARLLRIERKTLYRMLQRWGPVTE